MLIARYKWTKPPAEVMLAVVVGGGLTLAILTSLLWSQPHDGASLVWLVFLGGIVAISLVVIADFAVLALRRSPALTIDEFGILLHRGPVLGRRPAWGGVPRQVTPWSRVVAIRVGKLRVDTESAGISGPVPMTVYVLMLDVGLRDGSHVYRDLKGVQLDQEQLLEAINRYAPHVRYTEGAIPRVLVSQSGIRYWCDADK